MFHISDEVINGKVCWNLSFREGGRPGDSVTTGQALVVEGTLPEAAPEGTESLRAFVVDERSNFGPDCPDSIDHVELRADIVRALCGDDGWALLASDTEERRITMSLYMTLSPTLPQPNVGLQTMFAAPPVGWQPPGIQPPAPTTQQMSLPFTRDIVEGVRRNDPDHALAQIHHSDYPTCRLVLMISEGVFALQTLTVVPAGGELTLNLNDRVVREGVMSM
jgi:hypothetical protein